MGDPVSTFWLSGPYGKTPGTCERIEEEEDAVEREGRVPTLWFPQSRFTPET